MAQMYLISQAKPEGQFAHYVFKPEDIDELMSFIALNNSVRWVVETVQVYEPTIQRTTAEKKARREEMINKSLPIPLSRS
jgi:hypothetical protein